MSASAAARPATGRGRRAAPRARTPERLRRAYGPVRTPERPAPSLTQRQAASRDRRRLDDRGRRLAEDGEAVDDLLEVHDVAHVRGHDVAVVAGHPAALHHLGRLHGELGDVLKLARRRPDPDHDAEHETQGPRVDLGAVAGDHAVALEPLHAFGDGGRRQADAPPQFREGQPGVGLELGQQAPVGRVDRRTVGDSSRTPCIRSHVTHATSDRPYTRAPAGRMLWSMTWTERLPPHVFFVVSAVFHYLGPAFAVLLFARVDVLGVAWLRIGSAALVFALWRRPWRALARLDRAGGRLLAGWGAVLALMNASFYLAIERLPLATVAAIEFVPVVALAALGARTPRNLAALALAVPGVYLLTGVRLEGAPLGVALAVANAVLFAAYIVLAHRVAHRPGLTGIDGLAASMLVAAVVVTPLGGWEVLPALTDPVALLAGIGVGLCSSVIPYVSDQLAMRRLPRATYALMVSLLPATATVIGIAVLAQVPSWVELAGVVLVIAGVAIHRQAPEPQPQSARAEPAERPAPASALAAAAGRHS